MIKKCLVPYMFLMIIFSSLIFISEVSYADEESGMLLGKGINLYEQGKYEDSMDYFIDVLLSGSPTQITKANEYINKIHLEMAKSYSEEPEIYERQETISEMGQEAAYTASEVEVAEKEIRGEDQITPIKSKQEEHELMQEKRAYIETLTKEKIAEMKKTALLGLNEKPGIEVYMRKDMANKIDAIDINPDVLFSNKEFRSTVDDVLEDIYILMLLEGKAVFTILPKNAFNGQVSMENTKQVAMLSSYLIQKGISSARVNLNIGLTTEKVPPKFADLEEMSIIFDYEEVPNLKYKITEKKEPKLSLGVYPETGIYLSKDELFVINFSARETSAPIDTWEFQIIQKTDPNVSYTIRQAKGEGAIFQQAIWNGRKEFFGDYLPRGVYNLVFKAKDINGNENLLVKKVFLLGEDETVKERGKVLYGSNKAMKEYKEMNSSAEERDMMDYSAKRLWEKPERIALNKQQENIMEETSVETQEAAPPVQAETGGPIEESALGDEFEDEDFLEEEFEEEPNDLY